jgi:phosphatidylglycerophosphate synthase
MQLDQSPARDETSGVAASTVNALLFATEATPSGTPTALLPLAPDLAVIDQFAAELNDIGITEITVVARPAWADRLRAAGHRVVASDDVASDLAVVGAVISRTTGSLVLAAADIMANAAALAQIAGSGVRRTAAAVQTGKVAAAGAFGQPVMRDRDLIVSVGTHYHRVTRPNATFRGLIAIADADRERLHEACAEIRTEAAVSGRDLDTTAGEYGAVGLALLALVRTGVVVSADNIRLLHCRRVDTADSVAAALPDLAEVDEDRAALRIAIKEDDEFFATYAVNSYTPRLVTFFARRGITPTTVTWISIGIGVAAALVFATGNRIAYVFGAILLYFSFVFDCCDGQLARYTKQFSKYGGWLDMIADRAKEYLVFAGLAIGGVRTHHAGMWGLAIAAIILQTVRHMIDTWYGALQEMATRALPTVPLGSAQDALGLRAGTPTRGAGAKLGQLSAAAHGRYRSPAYWLKRSVVLPIGDRWLVIALAAALFGPRGAFLVLLTAVVLAFAYVCAGRTLRARAMRVPVMTRYDIPVQRDDGPIARLIGRMAGTQVPPIVAIAPALIATLLSLGIAVTGHVGRHPWVVIMCAALALLAALGSGSPHAAPLDWLVTAGLRAMEYTFIAVAGVYGHVPLPLVYTLLGVLVLYHYDLTGRIEKQATPVRGERILRGWDIRVVLLALAAAAGWSTPAFVVLIVVVGGVFLCGALAGWSASRATG